MNNESLNVRERLQAVQTALQARGVSDVKFFFSHTEMPLSETVADVVEILEGYVKDQSTTFDLGDSVRKA